MTDFTHEYQARIDLAAAFRWAARWDMDEATANHFSLALNEPGTQFLLNPAGSHFSRICASDLVLLDADQPAGAQAPNAPDRAAFCELPFASCTLRRSNKSLTTKNRSTKHEP